MSENKDQKTQGQPLDREKILKELESLAQRMGMNKKIDWTRPIAKTDIQYILDRWPFLEIKNPYASETEDEDAPDVEFFTAMSGWLIHDYGDSIASSPGIFLFGGGYYYVDWGDEDEGSDAGPLINRGIVNPKKGTIINQMFLTAIDMINLALYRKWKAVEIVGGHARMKWAAWFQANMHKLKVTGYQPTEKEIKKAQRLQRTREEMDRYLKKKRVQYGPKDNRLER
jgi:hypothetical protein